MEATTTIWLTKPMAPQDAESVAVMRWAIEEDAAREGSLAGECLAAARAAGLSAEDTYVFLAYELLLRLEEQQQRHKYLSDIAPFIESTPSSPRVDPAPSPPVCPRRHLPPVSRRASWSTWGGSRVIRSVGCCISSGLRLGPPVPMRPLATATEVRAQQLRRGCPPRDRACRFRRRGRSGSGNRNLEAQHRQVDGCCGAEERDAHLRCLRRWLDAQLQTRGRGRRGNLRQGDV